MPAFGDKITDASAQLADFIYDRLAGSLRERGYSAQEVDAVLALRPQRLALVRKAAGGRACLRRAARSPALAAAANKRVGNILKRPKWKARWTPREPRAAARAGREGFVFAALQRFVPEANAQFDAGDYTASLQTLAVLRAPVDAFFDDVMVNAEQMDCA